MNTPRTLALAVAATVALAVAGCLSISSTVRQFGQTATVYGYRRPVATKAVVPVSGRPRMGRRREGPRRQRARDRRHRR